MGAGGRRGTHLKWQPYEARLFLPLLVAGAPLSGAAQDWGLRRVPAIPRALVQIALCVFVLSAARRPTLENWVRPLKGVRSVLRMPRRDQYCSDMVEWDNGATYKRTVSLLAPTECSVVGIDSTNFITRIPNNGAATHCPAGRAVRAYRSQERVRPLPAAGGQRTCSIVYLDCAGDRDRQGLYNSFPAKITVDKFVVFH